MNKEKLKKFSIEKFLFELSEEEKKSIIEKELSRLYCVLDKLHEIPLPPREELATLLRIPAEDTHEIDPVWAAMAVKSEIIVYEDALKNLKTNRRVPPDAFACDPETFGLKTYSSGYKCPTETIVQDINVIMNAYKEEEK